MLLENTNKDRDSMRTVQRAIDILHSFTNELPELTLTEISKKVGLAKSTVTRLLSTLEQNYLVIKNPQTMKYRLGLRLYHLGYLSSRSINLKENAKPIMDKLRDFTMETVNLYVLENERRVCVEQSEGIMSIRHLVQLGERLPLWAGAGGKAILAYQSDEYIQRICDQYTDADKTKQLLQQLQTIKTECFAFSIDEREVGSSAAASPIFNLNGEVSASLSVSGPSTRFTMDKIEEFRQQIISSAAQISTLNGYMRGDL